MFRKYIGLLFLMALTGCVSVGELQQQLANTVQTTHSYNDMNYTLLVNSKPQTIELNAKSPTFLFDEGKSYYSAFSLPDIGFPHKLNIKTYLNTNYLPSTSVLVPNFVFLDSSKSVVKSINSFRLDPGVDFWLGGLYEGYVVVPSNAVYLVIYANNSISKLTTNSENGHEWPVPYAPSGKLSLLLSKPLAADYDFSTVNIKDSIIVYSDSKADFFYVSEIDGKKVDNSATTTRTKNAGRGLSMTPSFIDRDVEIKPMTISIVGRTNYAAPIQALTNPVFEVKGQIKFIPEKNRSYQVVGQLGEGNSMVWIEEVESHKVMGDKIINHDAGLGILEK